MPAQLRVRTGKQPVLGFCGQTLCFCKTRQLCVCSESVTVRVLLQQSRSWAKAVQVALVSTWWYMQGKVHTLCVQKQGCNEVIQCSQWMIQKPLIDFGCVPKLFAVARLLSIPTHPAPFGWSLTHSFRSSGPETMWLKYCLRPFKADWQVAGSHCATHRNVKMNLTWDSDRILLGGWRKERLCGG